MIPKPEEMTRIDLVADWRQMRSALEVIISACEKVNFPADDTVHILALARNGAGINGSQSTETYRG
jgi:hypothetical protein